MEIDGDNKDNHKKQHLDESELIQVFEVETDNLMEFIKFLDLIKYRKII